MRCRLLTYTCAVDGTTFDDPHPDEPDVVLVRSEATGERAVLTRDAVGGELEEAEAILAELPQWRELVDSAAADHMRHLFGVVMDPAPDGSAFNGDSHPPCPTCGSRRMRGFRAPEPPRLVECDLRVVTFERWNAEEPEQRAERPRAAFLELRSRVPLPPMFEVPEEERDRRRAAEQRHAPKWWQPARRRAAESYIRSALREPY